jgi:Flp pilus assembly pilin Flp
VEYAILVATVAAVIVTAVSYFGSQVIALFQPAADFFVAYGH